MRERAFQLHVASASLTQISNDCTLLLSDDYLEACEMNCWSQYSSQWTDVHSTEPAIIADLALADGCSREVKACLDHEA